MSRSKMYNSDIGKDGRVERNVIGVELLHNMWIEKLFKGRLYKLNMCIENLRATTYKRSKAAIAAKPENKEKVG